MSDVFVWEMAGPKERADMVRMHQKLLIPELCKLFGLTEYGVDAIMNGANWAPACSAAKARTVATLPAQHA